MEIGLIGLPLVGKTTFFNLLTGAGRPTGVPGETKVHVGSAAVPDRRIDFLATVYRPAKVTYARVDVRDIPGLDPRGGDRAAGVRFLEEVRRTDALCFVVRAFGAAAVPAYFNEVLPFQEFQELHAEILLADILLVERRLEHIKSGKKAAKQAPVEIALLERCLESLSNEQAIGKLVLAPEEAAVFAGYGFLTVKPIIAAVNLDETGLRQGNYPQREMLISYTAERGIPLVEVSAQIEAEIAQLHPGDRTEFLNDLGLEEPGIVRLAQAAYRALGLISFFTVDGDELKAWTVKEGSTARRAAGRVHSDMERGFIRAEVMKYRDLERLGSPAKVREAGLLRVEGKDYIVRDGDVIHFRFKV
ncbi:MAG TPA: redox-regulated ATPase YchF [Desulfotomaculum sp.]|nr:redox-regulated ATPase YchF [Desulfotomaculum sp.]